jgi:aldehyde dehydrogenase (NAD+)
MNATLASSKQGTSTYGDFLAQFIGGEWRDGGAAQHLSDTDPYTGKEILSLVLANAHDLDKAFLSAEIAQRTWAKTLPRERSEIMARASSIIEARREEIISWLVRESGSTRIKAQVEWQFTRDVTSQAASYPYRVEGSILQIDIPGKESRSYRRPLGVVGVISPWNFPMYLSQRTIAPALAVGNAVVVKPAPDTPVTGGLLMGKIFEEAGLPAGLFNVINGDLSEVGDAFTLHRIPKFISFTGSTKVGKHIGVLAMTGSLKRVALELGGNAPQVVLEDADVDLAVRAAVVGRFLHQGQVCMSTNRLIVHSSIYSEFVEKFVEHVRGLKIGDPNKADTVIGPVINKKQLNSLLAQVEGARSRGIKQLLGGAPNGLVLSPQVFSEVNNDDSLAQTEQFGPVIPIIRAKDEKDALRLANDTPYGLSSSVFTQDERRGLAFALQIEAGMTHINDHSVNDAPTSPFGGEKESGLGRFGAEWIINELTTSHWITTQREGLTYPF